MNSGRSCRRTARSIFTALRLAVSEAISLAETVTVTYFGQSSISDDGTESRTRTGTELPPLAPEASASTNSATSAFNGYFSLILQPLIMRARRDASDQRYWVVLRPVNAIVIR